MMLLQLHWVLCVFQTWPSAGNYCCALRDDHHHVTTGTSKAPSSSSFDQVGTCQNFIPIIRDVNRFYSSGRDLLHILAVVTWEYGLSLAEKWVQEAQVDILHESSSSFNIQHAKYNFQQQQRSKDWSSTWHQRSSVNIYQLWNRLPETIFMQMHS